MKTDLHFSSHIAHFVLQYEILQMKDVEKIKILILCSVTFFFFENLAVCEKMETYCTEGQDTEENIAPAQRMLDI